MVQEFFICVVFAVQYVGMKLLQSGCQRAELATLNVADSAATSLSPIYTFLYMCAIHDSYKCLNYA